MMAIRRVVRCPNCDAATPKKPRFTDAPSPFRDLIAVNGAACGSQLDHYLQGVRADISAQDETIGRIEIALREAQDERNHLQRIADSHIGLMSAFRRFPPEILAQVFQSAVASPPDEQPKGIFQVFQGLWRIGSVCRLWRSTVLSNPSLWACFTIGFGSRDTVSLLETVLVRSREAGMTVAIRGSVWHSHENYTLKRVLGTSHRWKRVWIEVCSADAGYYEQIRGRLPLLEQLSLSAAYNRFPGEDFRAFENAPRLRKVALGLGISPACHRLVLPWSQITSLYMRHSVETSDVRAVLSMTPNLRSLSFQHSYGHVNDWEPKSKEDTVTCVSLQSITVHDTGFFQTVTFPVAEEINLATYEELDGLEGERSWVDIFHDFLDRSGSPVKKLKLYIREISPNYERMLYNAFRLTHLDITVSSLAAAGMLFRVLVLTGDKTNVLPQLQCMKAKAVEVTKPDTFVEEINLGENIVDMLVSRYHLPSSSLAEIESAYINLPRLPTLFWTHVRARVRGNPRLQSLISTTSENGRVVICMGRATESIM
ncbi:uncharacterized protein EV420DRAFT_8559 [Desarmillaria tabescens]|uniref:F-box domain-containing protein n=1 Tax=Armillaria tabescens TaxID=1929756 RepID=A0AA39NNX7_ARMTA|nr:uncharacterized protein EV420DRAFT_8559 [Desarmillaria tabescens]KAK0469101.1 hypothetical protein EV420DRAFT_8559 [Desarmillaria tabescens]